MNYPATWFVIWSFLWAVFFTLDGFDFGAGILRPFISRSEEDRQAVLNAIAPVWDGNQVWLITAGAMTFAAFPAFYASMFSFLYSALIIILFALILRGVTFEFRGHRDTPGWRSRWDLAFFLGNLVAALLFGVAFGNIFKGLPFDASGYHGTLLGLLNPYGLLTGVLFVLLFVVHGGLWLRLKTAGVVAERSGRAAGGAWYALLAAAVLFLIYTNYATSLYDNFRSHPAWAAVPLVAVLALLGIKLFLRAGRYLRAFLSSVLTIITVVSTGVIGLYPNLIPSSLDPAASLTIYNSSSTTYALRIMTVVAFIFVPVVIVYQLWMYRIFRGEIAATSAPYGEEEAH